MTAPAATPIELMHEINTRLSALRRAIEAQAPDAGEADAREALALLLNQTRAMVQTLATAERRAWRASPRYALLRDRAREAKRSGDAVATAAAEAELAAAEDRRLSGSRVAVAVETAAAAVLDPDGHAAAERERVAQARPRRAHWD